MQSAYQQQEQSSLDGKGTQPDAPGPQTTGADFFDRNNQLGAEIIEGTIREGQICIFGGPYGVGKSPMIADITLHVLTGRDWKGRLVQQRPVIVFDFESSGPAYRKNIKNIAARMEVPPPRVPDQLDIYLEHDPPMEPATAILLAALQSKDAQTRLDLLEQALRKKPNALVFIDPVEILFTLDTNKRVNILWVFTQLRLVLGRYPHAAVILTFNLRKQDRRIALPDLLTNPRGFLQEVCGSGAILDRSDVRLGMNIYGEDTRVINGIRRGEEFHPLLVRPVGDPGNLAGFELVTPTGSDLASALTASQFGYWNKLPCQFAWDDVVGKIVPKASLSRLIARAKLIGALVQDGAKGPYRKVATP